MLVCPDKLRKRKGKENSPLFSQKIRNNEEGGEERGVICKKAHSKFVMLNCLHFI